MIPDFDFEVDKIIEAIKKGNHTTITLQFPEGLKRRAAKVVSEITGKADIKIIISGEPCYGACDLPASTDGLLVNFGHYPIPNLVQEGDILFIPARSKIDPLPVLKKALPELEGIIGVISTPQHIHMLGQAIEFLQEQGIRAVIGKGSERLHTDGQVLGCNTSAARNITEKIDMLLFIGTGNFHPLALALGTKKPIIIADPVLKEIRKIDELKEKVLRQRHAVITQAKEAKTFGILLSTKQGQRREELAHQIADKLKEAGKSSVIIEMETATPQKLDAFKVDAWVSTACPRLAIDDYMAYTSPIITPPELDIILGHREWEDYIFDEIE
ncbi:MAG: diphthamide biosynthesis enzyme Dph2 [Thermoplasmata archaeon]|nr:diphthamide biosynthesis enzyme Dph2 [Thermoplasmata archaeon]